MRATSFGQALYTIPVNKPNEEDAVKWFKVFFKGQSNPLFAVYLSSEMFEDPIYFRLDNFAEDEETRKAYSVMIKHCLLPVGMSTGNRITKPGYESY